MTCISISFHHFCFWVCPFLPVLLNKVAAEICSSRMWRWQTSNYRSDICVSHLWPAWPAISPTDAECEMREPGPVIAGAGEGSAAQSGMSSITGSTRLPQLCHRPPLTDCWPHWGRSSSMIKYLSGIRDSQAASLSSQRTIPPPHILYHGDIFINKQHLMAGSSRTVSGHMAAHLWLKKKQGLWRAEWSCERLTEKVVKSNEEMGQHRPDVFFKIITFHAYLINTPSSGPVYSFCYIFYQKWPTCSVDVRLSPRRSEWIFSGGLCHNRATDLWPYQQSQVAVDFF